MASVSMNDTEEIESGPHTSRSRLATWQIVAIVAALVAAVAVTAWFAWGRQDTSVSSSEISFSVTSPESTTLTFSVTKPKDLTVRCTVEALSHTYVQVGFQELVLGPASTENQQVTVAIPTTEEAVSALVRSCVPA